MKNLLIPTDFSKDAQKAIDYVIHIFKKGRMYFLSVACLYHSSVLPWQLGLRTQDHLGQGVSSFYAELKRIEKLLKLIEGDKDVFFLLDEMFKGTNSEDRYKGGFSLIHQIKQLNTSGIIATHDIELAKLTEDKMLIQNYSFNSKIKGGSMIFNYKLTPGVCHDFNASELMKKSGIYLD